MSVFARHYLFPIFTLPKARLVGFELRAPGIIPVPDTGMVSVGLVAVEVTVTAPLALPADAGANLTVKVALCPEVRVMGVEMPLRVNPLPLTPTLETVTLAPPVFVTVSDRD